MKHVWTKSIVKFNVIPFYNLICVFNKRTITVTFIAALSKLVVHSARSAADPCTLRVRISRLDTCHARTVGTFCRCARLYRWPVLVRFKAEPTVCERSKPGGSSKTDVFRTPSLAWFRSCPRPALGIYEQCRPHGAADIRRISFFFLFSLYTILTKYATKKK